MKAYYLFSALLIIMLFSGYGCNSTPEETTPPYLDIFNSNGTNAQARNDQVTNANATNESTNSEATESSSSVPTVQVDAEHYISEYNLSTIGVTLTPLNTAGETFQEVSIPLPDPLPLPYAEIININLNGTEGWECSSQIDPAPQKITCTGPIGMAEKKKSVFTLFFNEQLSPIPSSLDITISSPSGFVATTAPVVQN